jgi:hypothetical protein
MAVEAFGSAAPVQFGHKDIHDKVFQKLALEKS